MRGVVALVGHDSDASEYRRPSISWRFQPMLRGSLVRPASIK